LFQHSKSSELALNADDFLFLDSGHYSHVSALKDTAVFRFGSPVYFATLAVFKKKLFASTVSLAELRARQKLANKYKDVFPAVEVAGEKSHVETDCEGSKVIGMQNSDENVKSKEQCDGLNNAESDLMSDAVDGKEGNVMKQGEACDIKNIIVECSTIPFIDTSGCTMLAQLHAEYNKHGVKFVLAGCCDDVVSTLKRVEPCHTLCKEALYPSLQSAVLCLHCNLF